MSAKETSKPTPATSGAAPTTAPLDEPGFHVIANGDYCGTFVDEEQAQAYIDGQLTPQDGIKAEIVEVSATAE